MPQTLPMIDEIAFEKQRDVLWLQFKGDESEYTGRIIKKYNYEQSKVRPQILVWLEANEIEYCECFASGVHCGYEGEIYIDLPFDKTNEKYLKLERYLEDENGNMKIDGVIFWLLPLERARHYTID